MSRIFSILNLNQKINISPVAEHREFLLVLQDSDCVCRDQWPPPTRRAKSCASLRDELSASRTWRGMCPSPEGAAQPFPAVMGSGVRCLLALQSFPEAKHLLGSASALFTHGCTEGCGACFTKVGHEKAESRTCGIDPRSCRGFQLSFSSCHVNILSYMSI